MEKQKYSIGVRFLFFRADTIIAIALGVFTLGMGASSGLAQENNLPKQEKSAADLRLEYANLSLQLAETELKLAQQFNRELEASIPSSFTGAEREKILNMKRISKTSIERLKSNVAIGKTQLDQAVSPSTGSLERLRIRYAEEKIRLAKVNLDAANADKLQGKKVPDLEVARRDLKYRMALIDRELLENPAHLATLVDSLQRQIDQLREDLIKQDQRINAVEDHDAIPGR